MALKYKVIKELDKGSFGEVSLAKLIDPASANEAAAMNSGAGQPSFPLLSSVSCKKPSAYEITYVIKKIDKSKASDRLIANEIEAGRRLKDCHGIPKFIETFTDSKFCYLIFEYFEGQNLYNYLEQRNFRPMKEKYARKIFRQLLRCLLYAHEQKVCHRDLKLENVLYNPKLKKAKLIDFGLCAIQQSGCSDMCANWCGSPDYVCPEILLQKQYHGCQADVWGFGTILYILLFGQMPFNFKERFHALQHKEKHPELDLEVIRVTDSAKDLLRRMLSIDPKERITIEEIALHKWVTKKINIYEMLGFKHWNYSHDL
jgi:serine/threonine protein kinase